MNVLILATQLDPDGISRYCLSLAKGLIASGNRVWFACSGGEWVASLKEYGIGYKFIPIRTKSICSIKILLSFFKLRGFIIREKIDIIHGNTRVTQVLSFLICKLLGRPYISSFHGFYRPKAFRRILKFSGKLTIAVSKAVREHLIKDLYIKEDKARVVYNGLDLTEFLVSGQKRSNFGLNSNDYLVGILGRISQEKGHFLAVDAVAELSSKHKNIHLLVSGKGRLEAELKLYVENRGMSKRVKFLDCNANSFLDIIDLLLVPSKKEGFGYSIIEAFVKSVPVIGHNVGGIPEIIKNRKNGLLFYEYNSLSLAQRMEELIAKPLLRQKIIAQAKKDVLFYTCERMALETKKIYQEALDGIRKKA